MQKQNSYLLTAVLSMILFISCNQEIDESIENKDTVLIEKGMLTFQSEASFKEILEHLKTLSDNEIKLWTYDLEFHNSHFLVQDYYDSMPTDTDISLHEKLKKDNILYIPDPAFSAILNKEGLYKIGEEYHRITESKEYISKNYDVLMNPIENVKSGKLTVFGLKPSLIRDIQKANLNGQTLCAKNLNNSYTGTGFDGGNYFNKFHPYPDDFYSCGGGDYSFHTQTWYIEYSNYYSVGTWIKGRKYKKKGLRKKWRDDKMAYAKINNNAKSNITKHTVYFNVSRQYGPVHQNFIINYEYNDENKGLRKVNMRLSTQ